MRTRPYSTVGRRLTGRSLNIDRQTATAACDACVALINLTLTPGRAAHVLSITQSPHARARSDAAAAAADRPTTAQTPPAAIRCGFVGQHAEQQATARKFTANRSSGVRAYTSCWVHVNVRVNDISQEDNGGPQCRR